jgi:DNA polymerase-3 subunit beta
MLRCNKSRFRLMSLDPREFPHLSTPEADMATFALPVATLQTMIDHTLCCAVTDESRPNLNGVLCTSQVPDLLRFVASDGHRLALIERAIPGLPTTLASLLFPAKGMTEARKLLDCAAEEMVTIGVSASIATLTVGDTTLTLRLGAVDFPDYHGILTMPHPYQLSVGRTELLAAIRRLLVLTTEHARGVTLMIRPEVMELSVATGDIGEGTEEIPITYNGPSITIGFNARYLLDFLVAVEPAEHVIFELNEPTTPALLRTGSDDGYRYVVMPLRVF